MAQASSETGRISISFPLRYARDAAFLGVTYFVVMWVSEKYIPHPATLFPAAAIAVTILFFEGIELWPFVFIASFVGYWTVGTPLVFLIILPIAQTLQAVAGAYLLRVTKFDPMIRRTQHVISLLLTFIIVSLIVPTLASLANDVSVIYFHTNYPVSSWIARYFGTFFCYLILGTFLLRWFAKVRFVRNTIETIEIVIVFVAVLVIDYFAFIQRIQVVLGIPLIYVLLLPLFWTALRLKPRFVTLALLITSMFGIASLYLNPAISPAAFTTMLSGIEELLIVLAVIFLMLVALEEDRSLNANIMRSQMATLENAVVRISSESNAKNSFIAILAHELRNPLAPVASSIDFLRLKEADNPQVQEALDTMDYSMQTVKRLLDDLLDISRISEGKITIKKERVNVQEVLKRAITSTAHHLREHHQPLTFKPPRGHIYVYGDAVRLEQVFSNLITNASKYSDPGDTITIGLQRVGDRVEVAVSDMGIGLSPETLETIFTPFHQVESGERTMKGLGIGLALVRSFVELHDGSIIAASEGPGKGSTFSVLLPLASETEELDKPTPSMTSSLPAQNSAPGAQKKPLHVLVVDDNDAAASGMGRLLELKGCRVSYAYDGKQAIEQSQTSPPDVILLDIGLPDQDGYSVAKMIRAWGYTGRLIALTGYSTEDARRKGADAGFDHYLVKPIGFNEIKEVIPELA